MASISNAQTSIRAASGGPRPFVAVTRPASSRRAVVCAAAKVTTLLLLSFGQREEACDSLRGNGCAMPCMPELRRAYPEVESNRESKPLFLDYWEVIAAAKPVPYRTSWGKLCLSRAHESSDAESLASSVQCSWASTRTALPLRRAVAALMSPGLRRFVPIVARAS